MSKTNGKSLEYVKKTIQSGRCNGMENDNFLSMKEINFSDIIKKHCKKNGKPVKFENNILCYAIPVLDENEEEFKINVSVEYNPDADFEYFTTERCRCDGTLIFYFELMQRILNKLTPFETCGKVPEGAYENLENHDIRYTVGDFALAEEYGDEFAKDGKPWIKARFTAMLPIKCEFSKNENTWMSDFVRLSDLPFFKDSMQKDYKPPKPCKKQMEANERLCKWLFPELYEKGKRKPMKKDFMDSLREIRE